MLNIIGPKGKLVSKNISHDPWINSSSMLLFWQILSLTENMAWFLSEPNLY